MNRSPAVRARGSTKSFGEVVVEDIGRTDGRRSRRCRRRPGPARAVSVAHRITERSNAGLAAQAIHQLDVTADGRYVADGDGPKEVNGFFPVRTSTGDAPKPP